MIPEKSQFSVSEHNLRTKAVSIKEKNLIHLASLFSDDIYSNKPLALIREYSANALDANIFAGKATTPIRVTLPTRFAPQLKIRDYGYGLTQDEMDDIYASIGESTKRDTNTAVGCFGLGCKAGYSYGSRSFLVISYNKGIKTTYNCVKSAVNFADIITMGSELSGELSGLEIVINIQTDDIEMFRKEAMKFFRYWTILPEFENFGEIDNDNDKDHNQNIAEASIRGNRKEVLAGTNWQVMADTEKQYQYDTGQSVAIMGNIAYPIQWDNIKGYKELLRTYSLKHKNQASYHLSNFITQNDLIFRFGIGEIKMSPNREALQYTDLTNNAILNRLTVLFQEIAETAQMNISKATNLWEARCMYDELFNTGALRSLKGYIAVNYAGKEILDNVIDGFSTTDERGNFDDSILTTHILRPGRLHFRSYTSNKYNWRNIHCVKTHAILEIDINSKVYTNKTCEYLKKTRKVSTVYVLKFKDAFQRKAIFDKTGLDDSFIIKYSTIKDAVKQTILTSSGGAGRVSIKNDSSIRPLRIVNSFLESRNYYQYRNGVNELPLSNIDMSKGGVFVETRNDSVIKPITNVRTIADFVQRLHIFDKTQVTVCLIGQNLINSKVMKSGNWVNFNDYLKTKITSIIDNNPLIPELMAFNQLRMESEYASCMNLTQHFIKFLESNNFNEELNYVVNLFNSLPTVSVLNNTISTPFYITDASLQIVKDKFQAIMTKYPLFSVIKLAFNGDNITVGDNNYEAAAEYFKK